MGKDSIEPFLNKPEKGVFILCRTSNPSAKELQNLVTNGIPIYSKVAKMAETLNKNNNVGRVVGSTAYNELVEIRKIVCDLPLLIPGVATLNRGFLAFAYGFALIYLFLGISIVAEIFMEAIEKKWGYILSHKAIYLCIYIANY